jgi:beta-glucosidase
MYGVFREYYPKQNFGGQMSKFMDENIDMNYRFETADPAISNAQTDNSTSEKVNNKFSVKWIGLLCPDISGLYQIKVDSHGTSLFSKAKVKVGETQFATQLSIELEAGKRYPIEIQFPQAGLGSHIQLKWKLPKYHSSITNLNFERELKAVQTSDVVLCYSGLSWGDEHEGIDRHDFNLSQEQQQLIKAVASANPNIVLILIAGSNLAINWENENIPAILHAWYPGERGGDAIANVIFGDYNPAGRLPLTFYRDVTQLPAFSDYDMEKGKTYWFLKDKPLYAFGFGLSYTTFEYIELNIDKQEFTSDEIIHTEIQIKNSGEIDGDEVAQLYIQYEQRDNDTPLKQLKAFKRVDIPIGETETISLDISIAELKFWDPSTKAYKIRTGDIQILVGPSSDDIRLTANAKIL